MALRIAVIAALAFALSACGGRIIPPSANAPSAKPQRPADRGPSRPAAPAARPIPATPIAPVPVATTAGPTARSIGVVPAIVGDLPFDAPSATRALKAFRISCPSVQRRTDQSGLTRPEDWRAACAAAAGWPDGNAVSFFAETFDLVQVGDGKAFATGYYEPEILGSRTQSAQYNVPVYRRPPDLIEVDLGAFSESLKGRKIRGRVEGQNFVPYYDRTAIEEGALAGRGLELAWAANAAEFFFLQVQGSGRLRLPDGSVMRIGYDGQNGHDYTGIDKLMRDRGLLGPGQTSMQGIIAYLNANPAEGRAIMRENKSWVFFRELTGPGPIGALGLPVTPRGTVAADPAFVPLGAPVFLSMDRAEPNGLWIAQDTGGAIKGSNRFDTFWGAGDEARRIAGGMAARGTAFVLLPKGVVARIRAEGNATP